MRPARVALAAALASDAIVVAGARSIGCGKTPQIQPGQHQQLTIKSARGGGDRDYILAVPSTYQPDAAVPLILSFHGNSKNATNQYTLSSFWNETWNPLAISVYPQGVDNRWTGAPYNTDGPDDVAFTTDLLDHLTETLCIDERRIYCSGKSLGGGFCNVLACDGGVSSRLAAIAPVSGAYYTTPQDGQPFSAQCHPARGSMPVLEFHGDNDTTIPFDGGAHRGVVLRSIPDWIQQWATFAGCSANGTGVDPDGTASNPTKTLIPGTKGLVTLFSWACAAGAGGENLLSRRSGSCSSDRATNGNYSLSPLPQAASVQHYVIAGLGHIWPSLGPNPDNRGNGTVIDATPLILDFFSRHSLPDAVDA